MTDGPRIGLALSGQPYTLSQMADAACAVEQRGADSVWIADDFWTGRDAFSILPCVALATHTVRVGTAVTNPYTRSPALLARAFSTLADAAAGRLVLGLGAGEAWKPLYPPGAAAPLGFMREAVASLRALLSGQTVNTPSGPYRLGCTWPYVAGTVPPYQGPWPVYLGAAGPRMTQLAGEIADGLLLGLKVRPDEVPTRRAYLEQGAKAVGRPVGSIEIAKLVLVSVTPDGRPQPNVLRHVARIVAELPPEALARLGYAPDRVARLRQAFSQGDYDAAAALLSPEMIRAHAVTGDWVGCVEQLLELTASGVQLPILLPLGGDLAPVFDLVARYTALRSG